MNQLFKKSSSNWIRYDRYEWKTDAKGILYITPCKDAKPDLYNPLKDADNMVLSAINLGLLCMKSETSKETLKTELMNFIQKYGLLGFMTALPTTPEFITYESVYLPLNHFIKEESMSTDEYLSYFFPFEPISFAKRNRESMWNITDIDMMAITMALQNKPQAVTMSFQKEYAERYDWLVEEFKDWAFTFVTSFLYYQDLDILDEDQKRLYRQGMAAFGGIAPTYHVELLDRPTIVWDFHSLLLQIQMMFSFMLTDEKSSIKVCKHCGKAFIASRPNAEFCSPQCKNQYNVYKSRSKKMDAMDEDDD
ncbi:hypothetical protein [Novisyntrophococcus fermenticellae]|uniref:hypothetical protein n=1 Tax=Novisyntrophococcus fermenticellae TaxID=2068655 RepID=UPI001E601A3E|nr:hypothetical protein [Novisyntrophococcus fermenticellae]